MVISREVREELLAQGAEEDLAELEAQQRDSVAPDYPRPTEADIAALRDYLEAQYRPLHWGPGLQNESHRLGGLVGLRKLRYGEDETPEKLRHRLNNDIRVRSMVAHRTISMVRALLGRNPLKVTVPAASSDNKAQQRAIAETRWANELQAAFERRALVSPIQESDDAQCEAFGGWEFYLTGAYDAIDFERHEDEDEREYERRITEAMRSAGLPFGIRALDPLSTLILPADDGNGVEAALIVERKPLRPLFQRLIERYGEDRARAVLPGNFGASGFGADMSWGAEVETIRYYDRYWYAYLVGGQFVDGPIPHGMPGCPIFPAWGFVTSARDLGQKIQGVAYALQFLEPLINDVLTQRVDALLTYDRPRPIASAPADAPHPDEENLDLSGNDLRLLPPGYEIADAFQHFRAQPIDPMITLLLGLGAQQQADPVLSGKAPGADISGFALNLQTANALSPYTALFRSKELAWGRVVDFARRVVRDTIREPVSLPVVGKGDEGQRAVEWLELRPEEVTDIPAIVELDPLSDLERIAITEWLKGGVAMGAVPLRVLMERGFNSPDWQEWLEEIDLDAARQQLRPLKVQLAFRELFEELTAEQGPAVQQQPSPLIFGPRGEPLSGQQATPSAGDLQQAGAVPAPPRPSTLGRQRQTPGGINFASAIAGQQPPGQPFAPGQGPAGSG